MSKLTNNSMLGSRIATIYKIGSLVTWSEWKIVDNTIDEDIFYGTVIEKTSMVKGGRRVCIIKVACFDTGEIISLNPFQLRLQDTNYSYEKR